MVLGDGFELTGLTLDALLDALEGYGKSKKLNFSFRLAPVQGGKDKIFGAEGDLFAIGGTGGDEIECGTGANFVLGDSVQSDQTSASFDGSNLSKSLVEAIGAAGRMLKSISLDAEQGDDTIDCGNGKTNLLIGGAGNDTLLGGSGAIDVLLGNDGADEIFGRPGSMRTRRRWPFKWTVGCASACSIWKS